MIQVGDETARQPERVRIVVRQVIDDTRLPGVHVAAAERLRVDTFAGGGLHQRRAAQEDRALLAHDDRFVGHRGHIGAARRAGAHHDGDLRDPETGHLRLVVEDPAEVIAVGKHLVLPREKGAAGVDEVNARQAIVERDLLRAQVLLDRDRVIGPALHRRVVRDDHTLDAAHAPDPRDDAAGRQPVVVELVPGELADLEKGRSRVEQPVDAIAYEHLAAPFVLRACCSRPALLHLRDQRPQFLGESAVDLRIRSELRGGPIDRRFDDAHYGGSDARQSFGPARRLARIRSACRMCGMSSMRPSSCTAPRPGDERKASSTRSAQLISSADGV